MSATSLPLRRSAARLSQRRVSQFAPLPARAASFSSARLLRPRTTTPAGARISQAHVGRDQIRLGTGPSIIGTRNMASAAETDTQAAAVANESGINETTLQDKLREQLGASYVVVQDISGGCGQSFEAIIVSPQFEKKTTLARHRLVNGALREEIAAIHAWTPKCFTPAEWEKKQAA